MNTDSASDLAASIDSYDDRLDREELTTEERRAIEAIRNRLSAELAALLADGI